MRTFMSAVEVHSATGAITVTMRRELRPTRAIPGGTPRSTDQPLSSPVETVPRTQLECDPPIRRERPRRPGAVPDEAAGGSPLRAVAGPSMKFVNTFGLLASVVGGIVAGALSSASGVPLPTRTRRRARRIKWQWREVLAAAAIQGAVSGGVKALIDRAGATGYARPTGVWPEHRDETVLRPGAAGYVSAIAE